MKLYHIFVAACVIGSSRLQAQLKIGANPGVIKAASILELEAADKGLLLPRVSLSALNSSLPLASDVADGTVIYNTNTALAGGAGLYIWKSSSWQALGFASAASTSLNGAYNFGGAGAGRTITASSGAVQILGNDGFQIAGTQGSGAGISLSGAGTRLFFNPNKAAFRAGYVDDNQWDGGNVGLYSAGLGYNTKASGQHGMALGVNTTASGHASTAMGDGGVASGTRSTAMGQNTLASGDMSVAMGDNTVSSGQLSFAAGQNSTASGYLSVVVGSFNNASNYYAVAIGTQNTASGQNSVAIGSLNTASGLNATALGQYTRATGDYSTTIGQDNIAEGNTSTVMGKQNIAHGIFSLAGGRLSVSNGNHSLAFGNSVNASGEASVALGTSTIAQGDYSTAMGYQCNSTGTYSTAMGSGSQASALASTAMGANTTAAGEFSTAIGYGSTAKTVGGVVVGLFNENTDAPNAAVPALPDRIFTIGNGSGNSTRSNAMVVLRNGNAGLGDNAPGEKLVVAGHIKISGSGNGLKFPDGTTQTTAATTYTPPVYTAGSVLFSNGTITTQDNASFFWDDANNRLGIGTATPATSLQVVKGGSVGISMLSGNAGQYAATTIGRLAAEAQLAVVAVNGQFSNAALVGDVVLRTETLGAKLLIGNSTSTGLVLSSNNVGIGTISPSEKLEVGGGVLVGGFSTISAQGLHLEWNRSGNEGESWVLNQKGTTITGDAGIRFGSVTTANVPTEWARFDKDGNLGINNTNPGQKLEVTGHIKITGAGNGLKFADGTTQTTAAWTLPTLTSGSVIFSNGTTLVQDNANYFWDNTNNRLGIGTAAPATSLHIAGATDQELSIENTNTAVGGRRWTVQSGGIGAGINTSFQVIDRTAGASRLGIDNTGNVGIGTTAPTAKLSVNGTANNSSGSWGVFSDARLKTIDRSFTDGLGVIMQLKPVVFHYNEKAPFPTKDMQIGVVAQELEKAAPYMVTKTNMGGMQDVREVSNQAYTFLLVNAVQELKTLVDSQQAEIAELKAMVARLVK